jgi:hypothetical protein
VVVPILPAPSIGILQDLRPRWMGVPQQSKD